jgi:hypothetical protein
MFGCIHIHAWMHTHPCLDAYTYSRFIVEKLLILNLKISCRTFSFDSYLASTQHFKGGFYGNSCFFLAVLIVCASTQVRCLLRCPLFVTSFVWAHQIRRAQPNCKTALIYQCMETNVLCCHRYLIKTGVKKMNNI